MSSEKFPYLKFDNRIYEDLRHLVENAPESVMDIDQRFEERVTKEAVRVMKAIRDELEFGEDWISFSMAISALETRAEIHFMSDTCWHAREVARQQIYYEIAKKIGSKAIPIDQSYAHNHIFVIMKWLIDKRAAQEAKNE